MRNVLLFVLMTACSQKFVNYEAACSGADVDDTCESLTTSVFGCDPDEGDCEELKPADEARIEDDCCTGDDCACTLTEV